MIIKLCWKDKVIMEIEKVENLYLSKIVTSNFKQACDDGFPHALLCDVKVIDNELPQIIKSRFGRFASVVADEKELVNYINKTNLKRETDYISVYVE